jgi:hypothetical protein
MRETPSRQRLQDNVTVAFGRLMHSLSAGPANFHYTTRIHPALTSFADEVCGTLARRLAYLMTLALLAIGASRLGSNYPIRSTWCPRPRKSLEPGRASGASLRRQPT